MAFDYSNYYAQTEYPGPMDAFGAIGQAWNMVSGQDVAQKFQEYMTDKQQAFQKELFDYQAKYNSPSEAISRLREAGLNPNFAVGNIANTESMPTPASSPSAPSSTMHFSPGQLMSSVSDLMHKSAETRLLNAEAKDKELEVEAKSKPRQFLTYDGIARDSDGNFVDPEDGTIGGYTEGSTNYYEESLLHSIATMSANEYQQFSEGQLKYVNWTKASHLLKTELEWTKQQFEQFKMEFKMLKDTYDAQVSIILNSSLTAEEKVNQIRLQNQTYAGAIRSSLIASEDMTIDEKGHYHLKPASKTFWQATEKADAVFSALGKVLHLNIGFGSFRSQGFDAGLPKPSVGSSPSSSTPSSPTQPSSNLGKGNGKVVSSENFNNNPAFDGQKFPGTSKTPTPAQASQLRECLDALNNAAGTSDYSRQYQRYLRLLDRFNL